MLTSPTCWLLYHSRYSLFEKRSPGTKSNTDCHGTILSDVLALYRRKKETTFASEDNFALSRKKEPQKDFFLAFYLLQVIILALFFRHV
jgi:hypothetical protein